MNGNKLSMIGRKNVPEWRSRKVYCGFPGVCILISEFMIVYNYQFIGTLMPYVVAVGSVYVYA